MRMNFYVAPYFSKRLTRQKSLLQLQTKPKADRFDSLKNSLTRFDHAAVAGEGRKSICGSTNWTSPVMVTADVGWRVPLLKICLAWISVGLVSIWEENLFLYRSKSLGLSKASRTPGPLTPVSRKLTSPQVCVKPDQLKWSTLTFLSQSYKTSSW